MARLARAVAQRGRRTRWTRARWSWARWSLAWRARAWRSRPGPRRQGVGREGRLDRLGRLAGSGPRLGRPRGLPRPGTAGQTVQPGPALRRLAGPGGQRGCAERSARHPGRDHRPDQDRDLQGQDAPAPARRSRGHRPASWLTRLQVLVPRSWRSGPPTSTAALIMLVFLRYSPKVTVSKGTGESRQACGGRSTRSGTGVLD